MVQLFKIPLDLQGPRTPPLRWHWQDEHWMMHVGASTFFPALYACDAFVDMSSYDWGNAEAQSGPDHEQHSVGGWAVICQLCRASNAQTT